MKQGSILFVILMALMLGACTDKEKIVRIGSTPGTHELLLRAASLYHQEFPDRKLMVYPGEGLSDSLDLAVTEDWTADQVLGNDSLLLGYKAMLVVFNSDHPCIQTLAARGASPAMIRKAFDGSLSTWDSLAPSCDPIPVSLYHQHARSIESKAFESYFQTGYNESGDRADSLGYRSHSARLLVVVIPNDPLALGYLGSDLAFDPSTGFRRQGLYILPVDWDGNGRLDDSEFIYDDLRMFSQAVSDGSFPPGLLIAQRFTRKEPEDPEVGHFLTWYRENARDICLRSGLIFP